MKREDATGLGFGGKKLRKLDYVFHEAVASKADVLVSVIFIHTGGVPALFAYQSVLGIGSVILWPERIARQVGRREISRSTEEALIRRARRRSRRATRLKPSPGHSMDGVGCCAAFQ